MDYHREQPIPDSFVHVSRVRDVNEYGHVMTDFSVSDFESFGYSVGDILLVSLKDADITVPYCTYYSNVDIGKELLLPDPRDERIYLCINMGDASRKYGIRENDPIAVSLLLKGGYLEDYRKNNYASMIRSDREAYPSDEVFANFREIRGGMLSPGKYYRFSSPTVVTKNRHEVVRSLIDKYQIDHVVDLASGPTSIGFDFESKRFLGGMKKVFLFLTEAKGKVGICCVLGQDRTGILAMLLQALSGATLREIRDDYMRSYENLYFVERGSERWKDIENKVLPSKEKEFLFRDGEACDDMILQDGAVRYLREKLGMTESEVRKLQEVLRS